MTMIGIRERAGVAVEPGLNARALVERVTESVILSYKVLEGKFHHIQDFLKSNRMLPSNLPLW